VSDSLQEMPSAQPAIVGGDVDIQITTARRYPRSIRRFIDKAMEMATLDEGTAGACFYALPRDGKTVEGPSARLAEICASAWGHMRVEGRVIAEDDRFVTSRGTAWDLESNVAIAFEARRRITNKKGQKYNEDMVATTANAATSIALRNAIFKVVPSAYWRPIYEQCRKVAVGDASTLADRRAKALAYFQKMGVPSDRVVAFFEVKGVEDIGLDHLATLHGIATSIKEGEITVDEAFPAPTMTAPQRKADADSHASTAVPFVATVATSATATAPVVVAPATRETRAESQLPADGLHGEAAAASLVEALDAAPEPARARAQQIGPVRVAGIKPEIVDKKMRFSITLADGQSFITRDSALAQSLGKAREGSTSVVLTLTNGEVTGCVRSAD
jgi:hypothetical protein